MENTDFKTIKLGQTIIVFNGSEKRTVSIQQNPELFETISNLIKEGNQEKRIKDILFNTELTIRKNSGGKIHVKNNKAFYKDIELPEFASKAVVSMMLRGITDFKPIELFYEKIKINIKNQERLNEIFDKILSINMDLLKFTKKGNILIKTVPSDVEQNSCIINSSNYDIVDFHLFDEELKKWTLKEWVLISPMDIVKIGEDTKYISEYGEVSKTEPANFDMLVKKDFERPKHSSFTRIITRKAKKLLNDFEPNKDELFVEIPMEELFDMKFEFMKELKQTVDEEY